MSNVRAAIRPKSRLDLHMKANALVKHTIHITSNQNVFNPQYSGFTAEIVKTATEAGNMLWTANGINVGDSPKRWERRSECQERACELLDSLIYMIEVAHSLYSLRKGKYEHWSKMTVEVRALARSWRDSDARRYGYLLSGTKAE